MDTKKITIDGKEVEYVTNINKNEIEDNSDLYNDSESLDDTIDLTKIIKSSDSCE